MQIRMEFCRIFGGKIPFRMGCDWEMYDFSGFDIMYECR